MYCAHCGHELPPGARTCPACHAPIDAPISFEQAIADAKRAAKDLAAATARVADRVAGKADRAVKDPASSARRGARRVATELDRARKEIERILDDL
jgi:cell division septum initiation protein DivIVA